MKQLQMTLFSNTFSKAQVNTDIEFNGFLCHKLFAFLQG